MMGTFITAALSAVLVYAMPALSAHEPHHATASYAEAHSALRRVTGVAIRPTSNGAEVAVTADSGSRFAHFTLDGPSRIVVDLPGTSLALTRPPIAA